VRIVPKGRLGTTKWRPGLAYLDLDDCPFNNIVVLLVKGIRTALHIVGMSFDDISLEFNDNSIEEVTDPVCWCSDRKNTEVLWFEGYNDSTQLNITCKV
jgi:hypothetical protein